MKSIAQLGIQQAELTHALRINEIIAKSGIGVTPLSVTQPRYSVAITLNQVIDALNLAATIPKITAAQAPYVSALRINQILIAINEAVYALNFNRSSIYGTLATRAIDVAGDIDIQFYTPSDITFPAVSQSIVAQGAIGTFTSHEFELFLSGNSGHLVVNIGGTLSIIAYGYQLEDSARYHWELTGNESRLYTADGTFIRGVAISRGAARQPGTPTVIGRRDTVEYFGGVQRDLVINGVLWSMDARDQTVQPSTPAGNNMTITGAAGGDWVGVS